MASFRHGEPTGLTQTRAGGSVLLGSRAAVAAFTGRHVRTVKRCCVPIACDVGTRAYLYDIEHARSQFAMTVTCCIPDGSGKRCGSPTPAHSPHPVCIVHMAMISGFFEKQDRVKLAHDAAFDRQASAPAPRLPSGEPRASLVYYVLMGARIKIGTTTNVKQRMNSYGPVAELLATEPGGRALEAQRHEEFNEYLSAGREWFDPGPRLRAHIERLMAAGAAA